MIHFADVNQTLISISDNLESATDKLFNLNSILLLVSLLLLAFLLGRIVAMVFRRFNLFLSHRADATSHLPTVERLRRTETIIVISIALTRVLLFSVAIYIWWVVIHPNQQPTAIIGASAIFAVVAGGVFGPVLRDLASGSMMMTEHWFGVGDHVKIEPFGDVQGIVERVTLRSTRIRGINGEAIWVNNQNIQAVRVSSKGIRTIAIELFVSHLEDGQRLIEETDLRLPSGSLMVVSPLRVLSASEVAENMWHITAIGQTAPGREWLLNKYAIEVLQELDKKRKTPLLKSEPIARNADSGAEKKFARAFKNANKVAIRPPITKQLKRAAQQKQKRRRIQ